MSEPFAHRPRYYARFEGVEFIDGEADINIEDLAKAVERGPQHVTSVDFAADNAAQAGFGAVALVAYVKRCGENEMEANVSDLLACLMHLCDALGVEFDDAVHQGRRDYNAEIEGVL